MTAFFPRTAIATLLLACALPAAGQARDVSCGPTSAGQTERAGTPRYTLSQGLRIIARAWLQGLKPPADPAFVAAGLSRFGFVPMEGRLAGLPPGFLPTEAVSQHLVSAPCVTCKPPETALTDDAPRRAEGSNSLDFQGLVADMKTGKLVIAAASF